MRRKSNHHNTCIWCFVQNRWERWLLRLSKINRTRSSLEHLTVFKKWSINIINDSSFDHPDGFAVPIHPAGPPNSILSLKCTRGKINMGGSELLIAFTAAIIVTKVPLSADVALPICFTPFGATILDCPWTVVKPVSSRFQILSGAIGPYLLCASAMLSKTV